MSGPAMGSFAMGHQGIMTGGLYVVDQRPSDLTGLLPVITAAFLWEDKCKRTHIHEQIPIIHTLTQRGKHSVRTHSK